MYKRYRKAFFFDLLAEVDIGFQSSCAKVCDSNPHTIVYKINTFDTISLQTC